MIQKDLQGNLWKCEIGTMSSGKTLQAYKQEIEKLKEENAQIGMLNADLSIYLKEHKARIDKAIRVLNSAKNHYDNDKTNWAIERTLRVLKGSDKEWK